jgi:hypothetical protein
MLLLPASFFAKKKNGITIIEKTSEAPIFNAINSSWIILVSKSRITKYTG